MLLEKNLSEMTECAHSYFKMSGSSKQSKKKNIYGSVTSAEMSKICLFILFSDVAYTEIASLISPTQ